MQRFLVFLLTLCGALFAQEQQQVPRQDGGLVSRADAIGPTKAEQVWMTIPFNTNIGEAFAAAKKEQRLVLLWVTGDNPLGRC